MSYTDDKLKYYEQIPVQFNALESTQSLLIWSRFGFISYYLNPSLNIDNYFNLIESNSQQNIGWGYER